MKQHKQKIFSLIFCIVLMLNILPVQAVAANGTTIRVGYCTLPNYHERGTSGNVTGYEVEYLHQIAIQTGWEYEYIQIGSWAQAIQMLREGEIDLLSPAQISSTRMTDLAYSSLPIGKFFSAIITLQSNEDISYGDYISLNQRNIGVTEEYAFNRKFTEYTQQHSISPNIMVFADTDSMIQALELGNIDAMVTNTMHLRQNMKIVDRLDVSSYYFMFRKDNLTLQNKLNDALFDIESAFPSFQSDLMKRYFPTINHQYYTDAEKEFAGIVQELNIGCPVNMEPISYQDTKTGEIKGITRDLLDLVSQDTGIKFNYIPLPIGVLSYEDLRKADIDVISCIENNAVNYNTKALNMSTPYFESNKVLVGKQGFQFSSDEKIRLGVSSGSQTLAMALKLLYPNFEIYHYNALEDALKAVLNDEIELTIKNQYIMEKYLAKPQYKHLTIIPTAGISDILSLSTVQNTDKPKNVLVMNPMLLTILNKGIQNITENDKNSILISHTSNQPYTFSLTDFIYQYQYAIFCIIIALCIAAGFAVYAVAWRQKSFSLLKNSEQKLKNITNNINGGVVVLVPQEGLKITYANDGFLELIQHPKEDYWKILNSDYILYVHPDDIPTIDAISKTMQETQQQQEVSVQLRIRCFDGGYIPTRFNGTIARRNDNQVEMYCVIVDISQEANMLEKLRMEQTKNNFIIEKSDEIIYEINLDTGNAQVSEMLYEVVGWTFSGIFARDQLDTWLDQWKIHPDDRQTVHKMFANTLERQMDGVCIVRLLTQAEEYIWCRIVQYVMQDSSEHAWYVIGKITNIDAEMREKLRLKEKTQLDTMTGLYNKNAFYGLAQRYLQQNLDKNTAIIFLDLDNFKQVNDKLGHIVGDLAIKDAGQKLQIIYSGADLISRFGGDEFCILVKDIPLNTLERKLEWMKEKMRQTYTDAEGEQSVTVTASIGVAITMASGYDLNTLLDCADKALYEVKKTGKNNYYIYNDSISIV